MDRRDGGCIKANSSVEGDDLSLLQWDRLQLRVRVSSPNVNNGIFVEDQNVVNNQIIPQNKQNAEHGGWVFSRENIVIWVSLSFSYGMETKNIFSFERLIRPQIYNASHPIIVAVTFLPFFQKLQNTFIIIIILIKQLFCSCTLQKDFFIERITKQLKQIFSLPLVSLCCWFYSCCNG